MRASVLSITDEKQSLCVGRIIKLTYSKLKRLVISKENYCFQRGSEKGQNLLDYYSFAKGGSKRGHSVAGILLLIMFSSASKQGNNCCEHKMFLKETRNILCVSDTNFVSATNVSREGNICARHNVPAT